MDYLPVFIKLKEQACLVVGAGEVAARKIDCLAKAGAKITVIAKEISPAVANMQITHALIVLQKAFSPEDLHDFK